MGAPSSPSGDGAANPRFRTFDADVIPITRINDAIAAVRTARAAATEAAQHKEEAFAQLKRVLEPFLRRMVLIQWPDDQVFSRPGGQVVGFLQEITSTSLKIYPIDRIPVSQHTYEFEKTRISRIINYRVNGALEHEQIEGLEEALARYLEAGADTDRANQALKAAQNALNVEKEVLKDQQVRLTNVKTAEDGRLFTVHGIVTGYNKGRGEVEVFDYHTGAIVSLIVTDDTKMGTITGFTAR
jgi:hypothetical protein